MVVVKCLVSFFQQGFIKKYFVLFALLYVGAAHFVSFFSRNFIFFSILGPLICAENMFKD